MTIPKAAKRLALWLEDRIDPEPGRGPLAYLAFALRACLWSITMDPNVLREDWPMRCYQCARWFDRDFFWNPWGPEKGPGLCCSEECCQAVRRARTPETP